MKIRACSQKQRQRGVQLLECLVYIAIFFVVADVGYCELYHCFIDSAAFRREADEITQSIHAGERWRADIRAATGPIETTFNGDEETVRIPESGGDIFYLSSNNQVRRRLAGDNREPVIVSNVKSSRMQAEAPPAGQVWRWELELTARHKGTMRPLFSFAAVAPAGGSHDR